MNNSPLELTLLIPVYNEQQLIRSNLETLFAFLQSTQTNYEILVVDDGSTDHTVQIVQEFLKNHSKIRLIVQNKNMGKGCAIQRGVLESRGSYIVFMDADLSYELDALDAIMNELIEGNDLAIGSRHVEGSLVRDVPPLRYFIGQVFSILVSLVMFTGIRDTQCGFKGFNAQAAREIFKRTTISRFGIDVEVLFIAKKLGFSISQIPVKMTGFRNDSRVQVIQDSIRMFFDLFRIRLNYLRGIYN
ncbi:dolichyl-phosphate beta-glucosyltransferase [Chloroflexota bacterium]